MRQYIMMIIVLLSFHAIGYAQQSLVSDQWQQRMQGLVPELKKEWTESLSSMDQPQTRSIGQSVEDLSNVTYTPEASFVLDYASYQKLTSESNLEFLVKLDTTVGQSERHHVVIFLR